MLGLRVGSALLVIGALVSCSTSAPRAVPASPSTSTGKTSARTFTAGFESLDEFAGMYVSPQTASTRHALVASPRHSGLKAHCGWLTGPGTSADRDGPNHRGYPTEQLRRLPGGGFATPVVIDIWVWADVAMKDGDWVSLATLSADASDRWTRVVTLNLDPA